MNQKGVAGFMVGLRNNQTTSLYIYDFKCAVYRHSMSLAKATATAFNSNPNYDIICPNGSVSYACQF
jgi:hypothetical protein